MKARMIIAAGAVLLAVVFLTLGCEDSDVTAPSGSTMTILASPASVFIDQDSGETFGQTSIIAQVVDPGGEPVAEVPVFFTSSGGFMESRVGLCNDGMCTNAPGQGCISDTSCPPPAVLTNTSGVAVDTLTLRLIEDPDAVVVTAQSTSLMAQLSVAKIVNLGPIDPVAIIEATPEDGQRTGLPFAFSGSNSTFDPQVNLTCFEWTIDSSDNENDQLVRSPVASTISLQIGQLGDTAEEQDLTVRLRVSDEPDVICDSNLEPEPGSFSIFDDLLPYQIRCDFTDPFVEAGNNKSVSFSEVGFPAIVTLTATAFDPESPQLTYLWECGNGTGGSTQSVTCEYQTTGNFTAVVTVENECGRIVQDSLTVTVNP